MTDAEIPPPRRWSEAAFRLTVTQAICQRIAEGEPLIAILATPGMPPTGTFKAWRNDWPDLEEIYHAAQRQRPSARRIETKRRRRYSPELGAELCQRLCEAQGLEVVCMAPDMPSQAAVYQWLQRHPEFAEMYGQARQVQAQRLFDQIWRIARHAHEGNWRSAKLQTDTLRWMVAKLAPDKYGAPAKAKPAALEPPAEPVWNVRILDFDDDDEDDASGVTATG